MKILAIGAHPDDIEPQIGGTLAKYAQDGADVLIVTSMSTSTGAESVFIRNKEGEMAAKCLGASYLSMGYDPHEFVVNRRYINEFDLLVKSELPDIIFSVSEDDSHHEHQIVSRCLRSALRKNKTSWLSINQAFPGGIGTHTQNYYSDISKLQSKKMNAVRCYESQIAKYGEVWLSAIEARDKSWGFNIGCDFAEVAYIHKWIVK